VQQYQRREAAHACRILAPLTSDLLCPPLAALFSWHDDYNGFKAGVKDLEVMLTNVIQVLELDDHDVEEGVPAG
jgi:hypothetical protein